MEEDLVGIGMKSIKVEIHMEFDGKASWVISVGELLPTQSVDQ